MTVNACDSNAGNCDCAWLQFPSSSVNWGNTYEYKATGSDDTAYAALALTDRNGYSLANIEANCNGGNSGGLATILERWDETTQAYWPLDSTNQPKNTWLSLESDHSVMVKGSSGTGMPSPFEEY